jgi:hypothetical protein
MAGHNLKSLSITNLDAAPVVPNTIGEGAPGFLTVINDYVSPVSADDTTSTYRLLRFPTNAKVKRLWIYSTLAGAGAGDIDIAFSDSTTDGTPPSLNALPNPVVQVTGPVDNKMFGSAQTLFGLTAGIYAEFTFKGTFTPPMQNIPMWNNLVGLGATQFTTDPGGFFDIYVKITTGITTGGFLGGLLEYVE